MSFSTILQLVLIPLGVTILGSLIYGYFSRRKKDYKITCEQLSLRQYKEKESDDVKISLSYKNEKVGDLLSVLTVRLVNNGKKDVAFNQVFENKIQIKLKQADILDIVIKKQSDKVGASIEKSDSLGWLLSWSILKKGEEIVIKIVSVYHLDKFENEEDIDNLEFVFRGNNLDRIEPIRSQRKRSFYWSFFIVCIFMLGLVVVLPLKTDVLYDVKVNDICIQGVKISYNEYTQNLVITPKEGQSIKTNNIQSITVSSKQPILSKDVVIVGIVVLVYLVAAITIFIIYRNKKKDFFYIIMMPFMMEKYHNRL